MYPCIITITVIQLCKFYYTMLLETSLSKPCSPMTVAKGALLRAHAGRPEILTSFALGILRDEPFDRKTHKDLSDDSPEIIETIHSGLFASNRWCNLIPHVSQALRMLPVLTLSQEEMNTVKDGMRRWEQWCVYDVSLSDPWIREEVFASDVRLKDSQRPRYSKLESWTVTEKHIPPTELTKYPRAFKIHDKDDEVVYRVTAKLIAIKDGAHIELHFEVTAPDFDEAQGR